MFCETLSVVYSKDLASVYIAVKTEATVLSCAKYEVVLRIEDT
jgi:hypothetical protein